MSDTTTNCVVPNCDHSGADCITEAEANMGFEEFFDKAAADEGLPQSVADEYKRAFAKAVGIDIRAGEPR